MLQKRNEWRRRQGNKRGKEKKSRMSRQIKSQFVLRRVGQQRYLQGGPHQRRSRHFVLRRHLRRCDNHLPKIFLGGRYKSRDGYCLIAPFKFYPILTMTHQDILLQRIRRGRRVRSRSWPTCRWSFSGRARCSR